MTDQNTKAGQRTYIAIDLKSFYASVECMERGLDPLTTNLVVADASRTEKTICLAVSPALKSYGIPGRPRLFEVISRVKEVNLLRLSKAPGREFRGTSVMAPELSTHPELSVDYIVAPPRMNLYMEYSSKIYAIYLKYISEEDIHNYSIDEVFMDVTDYLHTYGLSPHELAMKMIHDVLEQTGITATAGIGTNLYLSKVAMDIVAKHIPADKDGVRIAELDVRSYREKLWDHAPLTDFWRVGRGYAKKLSSMGLTTMGDIARYTTSEYGRDRLYQLFGVNAELLIDHAWGNEPTPMSEIKSYGAERKSLGAGQVLSCPYTAEKAKLIAKEMADALSLDLTDHGLLTDQIVLTVGYDIESLTDPKIAKNYQGKVTTDRYGRKIPEHAHGTINLPKQTSSTTAIVAAASKLYDRIVNPNLLVRRLSIVANKVVPFSGVKDEGIVYEQMDLFTDYAALNREREKEKERDEKERRLQEAVLSIQKKYGKNMIIKGMNKLEGATMIDRNGQVGGHKA